MLDENKKKQIIEALNGRIQKRKKQLICPMCGNDAFSLADGYFSPIIQDDLSAFKIGGSSIPAVSIICVNCGFMSQHAMGVLDLLPKKEDKKEEDKNNKAGGK